MEHRKIFENLWKEYSETNPSATKIHSLLEEEGETIVNDHVAFRTYDLPGINIEALSGIFIKAGYIEKGKYFFAGLLLLSIHPDLF